MLRDPVVTVVWCAEILCFSILPPKRRQFVKIKYIKSCATGNIQENNKYEYAIKIWNKQIINELLMIRGIKTYK